MCLRSSQITTLDLELRVDVISAGGVVLGLNGSDTTNFGGGLRLSVAF